MSKCVAEVQYGPNARFSLILTHDSRFELAGTVDGVFHSTRFASTQGFQICFEPLEKRQIRDCTVFNNFGDPRYIFAIRERIQHIGIRNHSIGLIKGTDQIFSRSMVDRRLPPHRRIDLRKQRGGHLNVTDTPLVACRYVARNISDNASAQRNDRTIAVVTSID